MSNTQVGSPQKRDHWDVRTLLIDCKLDIAVADPTTFESTTSLYDYDLVFWDPAGTLQVLGDLSGNYRGLKSLSDGQSASLLHSMTRRQKEFVELLKLGRTLVVIAHGPVELYVDTGSRETSGTGRNQKVTRNIEQIDLQMALPPPQRFKAALGGGVEIELADTVGHNLWDVTRSSWLYRCVIDEHPGNPLMRVSGTSKVVSFYDFPANGGLYIALPDPYVDDFDPEDLGEEEGDGGDHSDDDRERVDTIGDHIVRWIESLSPDPLLKAPSWNADRLLPTEVGRSTEMQLAESRLSAALKDIEELKQAQTKDERWKVLLWSDGDTLRRQAAAAFEELGFEVDGNDRGRSDLRLRLNDRDFVVEVKGATKSAAERHAAQLEKWVSEELAENVRAKGILVVNGWRLKDPFLRGPVFPNQMLPYSKARGHCLLTSIQLFAMVQEIHAGADPMQLARELLNTVGPMSGHDDVRAFLIAGPADVGP